MALHDLLFSLNNSNLGNRINNSKLGKNVETLSEKYVPRPSNILVNLSLISASIFSALNEYCETFVDSLDGPIVEKEGRIFFQSSFPNHEYRTLPFLSNRTVPVYELAGLGGMVVTAGGCVASFLAAIVIKFPLEKIENLLFGEQSPENIFKRNYAGFP